MSLTTFLDKANLKAAELARKANIPKSSISNHLKFEATGGANGKPLGLTLSLRATAAYPALTLEDLRPDWAERLKANHG